MIECPDFLPLGSVVRLRGSRKTMMVIGRALVMTKDDGGKEYYDYSLALYPEGLIGDAVVYSNHDCIDEVLFEGYRDDEDARALSEIAEILPKMTVPKADPQPQQEEW